MQIPPQEENQVISNDQKTEKKLKVEEEKPKWKFTKKHYLITFAVILLLLGAGIGLIIVFFSKKNYVAVTYINQRDDFSQVDEICIYQESQNMLNCTEVQINTTRVTVKKDDQNATNLILLKGLQLLQFTKNEDGTKNYQDLYDQNTQIDQYLSNKLRFLQNSDEKNNFCYNLTENECGDINEFPLLTFITDHKTGQVLQIGIPTDLQNSFIQPLISSIIHIGANTGDPQGSAQNEQRRILEENSPNLYRIGQLAFTPSYKVEELSTGEVVVTKKITKEDYIGNEQKMDYFKIFDQQQDTILDLNDQLKSSRIQINSIIDNSIISSDPNDVQQQEATQLTSESKLNTINSKIDEDITNSLNDIQSKQTISYYLLSELEDKLRINLQPDENQEVSNQNLNEVLNNQIDTQKNNSPDGNRLLDENGDVSSTEDTALTDQQGDCNSNAFTQKRKLKEVTLLQQKIAIQVEFQGQTNTKDASGYIRTCVTLNGSCVQELQRDDFSYKGKSVPDVKKGNSKTYNLFKTTIILLGYPVNVGADLAYSWGFTQQNIRTDTQLGLSQGVTASVSLTAYGEITIVEVIRLKAGVNGIIFKGSLNGKIVFAYDKPTGLIIPKKYLITLDFQMQALTFDVYAQYSGVYIKKSRKCIGKSWYKVCVDVPEFTFTDWKDIYRRSFQLAKSLNTNIILRIKSKCYNLL